MMASSYYILLGTLILFNGAVCAGFGPMEQTENNNNLILEIVPSMVQNYMSDCHLVLAAYSRNSKTLWHWTRAITDKSTAYTAVVTLEGETLPPSTDNTTTLTYQQIRWQSGLWRERQATCRVVIMDFTSEDQEGTNRLLEWAGLWTQPETRVVGVGGRLRSKTFLLLPALRNTLHAIFVTQGAVVWRRCGYCNEGEAGVELLGRWDVVAAEVPGHPTLYRDQRENYNRHQFRLVENNYFPYMSSKKLSDVPGTLVEHKDALGTRIISAMANSFNFTYEVREPIDRKWGNEVEPGVWNGGVGTLQREEADLSLDLTITPQRASVIQFAGAVVDEPGVQVSLKPTPLPQYLSLVRPFNWEVWLMVIISIGVWGCVVWLIQKVWKPSLGGRNFDLTSSLFYSLGIMLEDSPESPPDNFTGQMLVGWWLAACFLITSFYRSLLISHLVVQGRSAEVNSFADMVGLPGWSWGTKGRTGMLMDVLRDSADPVNRQVYKEMQIMSIPDGLQKVLEGGFTYVFSYYYMRILVETQYTDASGHNQIHFSKTKFNPFIGNTFCLRPGAPFLPHLSEERQRLAEAGLITYWMDDVVDTHTREVRRKNLHTVKADGKEAIVSFSTSESDQVVLTLQHLLGAFLVLALSHGLACLAFVVEQRARVI